MTNGLRFPLNFKSASFMRRLVWRALIIIPSQVDLMMNKEKKMTFEAVGAGASKHFISALIFE